MKIYQVINSCFIVFSVCNIINKFAFNDILYGNPVWELLRDTLFFYILIVGSWKVSTNTIWNEE